MPRGRAKVFGAVDRKAAGLDVEARFPAGLSKASGDHHDDFLQKELA